VVSQNGKDTQQAVPGLVHQQCTNDIMLAEDEVPIDITYPISQCRPEVSCIVYTCPHTFYQYYGRCRNDVCLLFL